MPNLMVSTLLKRTLVLAASASVISASAQSLAPIPAPQVSPSQPYFAPSPYSESPSGGFEVPLPEAMPYPSEVPPPGYVPPPVPEFAIHQQSLAQVPVVYRDLKRRHPCAVPMTVCVDTVCGPVLVDICVPPGCEPVVINKRRKIVYDFGKYEVEIHDRKNRLVVDYDR